ncbi:hypothetical protein BH24ACT5_BH24ACT5_19010 [soil metagenome]
MIHDVSSTVTVGPGTPSMWSGVTTGKPPLRSAPCQLASAATQAGVRSERLTTTVPGPSAVRRTARKTGEKG